MSIEEGQDKDKMDKIMKPSWTRKVIVCKEIEMDKNKLEKFTVGISDNE